MIECAPNAIWRADRNVYGVGSWRVGGKTYRPADFTALRGVTQQDAHSRWFALSTNDVESLRHGSTPTASAAGARPAAMRLPSTHGIEAK
jgi:hypothetical protein